MPKPPKEKVEKFITDVVEVDQVFSDGNNDRAVQVFYEWFFPDENWQPIETAPKDGTSVLLGEFGHGYNTQPFVASWEDLGRKGERWIGDDCAICPFEPTHWVSLPKPPKTK